MESINLDQIQEYIKSLDQVRAELEKLDVKESSDAQSNILTAIRYINQMYINSKEPSKEE